MSTACQCIDTHGHYQTLASLQQLLRCGACLHKEWADSILSAAAECPGASVSQNPGCSS